MKHLLEQDSALISFYLISQGLYTWFFPTNDPVLFFHSGVFYRPKSTLFTEMWKWAWEGVARNQGVW